MVASALGSAIDGGLPVNDVTGGPSAPPEGFVEYATLLANCPMKPAQLEDVTLLPDCVLAADGIGGEIAPCVGLFVLDCDSCDESDADGGIWFEALDCTKLFNVSSPTLGADDEGDTLNESGETAIPSSPLGGIDDDKGEEVTVAIPSPLNGVGDRSGVEETVVTPSPLDSIDAVEVD